MSEKTNARLLSDHSRSVAMDIINDCDEPSKMTLACEAAVLARMSPGWQPIETAPKDGVFQVWLPNPRFGSHAWPMRTGNVKLIGSNFALDYKPEDAPTHWRPEPSAPPTTPELPQ